LRGGINRVGSVAERGVPQHPAQLSAFNDATAVRVPQFEQLAKVSHQFVGPNGVGNHNVGFGTAGADAVLYALLQHLERLRV
jgi:hypothetical protein